MGYANISFVGIFLIMKQPYAYIFHQFNTLLKELIKLHLLNFLLYTLFISRWCNLIYNIDNYIE